MGTATRFWNWHAERYSRQGIADEASYRKKLAITQKYLTPEMRVVEFGCGTGSTAILHAPKVGDYHGIDVSEKMIEIARRKTEESALTNLHFTVGTLEQADVAPESCDVLLGLNILHLVPDLEGTLATVARALKPGGRFISSTICANELGGSLGWIARATRWIPGMPTVRAFSATDLDAMLTRAGFVIEERFEPQRGVLFLVTSKA